MGDNALCLIWYLRIGRMAVKGGRRRKGQTKCRRGRVCGLRGPRMSRRSAQKGAGIIAYTSTLDAMIPTTEKVATPANFTFEVAWPSGARATEKGGVASMNATHSAPQVFWTSIPNALFTLVVWDPDAAPESRAWLHWLVTNIQGVGPAGGQEVVPWAPPTPPAGTGAHRYIFGLFQQKWPLAIRVADRPLFNPKRFAELNGLHPVGYRTTEVSHDLRTEAR